jgi:putative PIN family toxin of toxin-antitoxin system
VNRLVVDTNVLVSSFLGTGPPRQILHRIRDGQDLLCLSAPILTEYLAVLRRGGVSDALLFSLLDLLRDPERVLVVEPRIRVALIHDDPQDNMFLECALAATASMSTCGMSPAYKAGRRILRILAALISVVCCGFGVTQRGSRSPEGLTRKVNPGPSPTRPSSIRSPA